MAKNKRQPYAVSEKAGHQTSAESWGTGQYKFHSYNHDYTIEVLFVCALQALHWVVNERGMEIGRGESKRLTFITQDVPLPVFLVSLVVELTALVRLPLVTCAALVACSPQQRSGESGTRRSTWARSENHM